MSERKVLNKYFPPDFDPSKIKRRKNLPKDPQIEVRLMAPFSMRCKKCGEFIYKGKKFNARKEHAVGHDYLGIKVWRFYIKCPLCSTEITFKTDPKNGDFIMEHNATRNFDNWKEDDPNRDLGALPDAAADDEYDSEGNSREQREARDAMADLERSQEASRREMEVMDQLADLRQRNARLETSKIADDPEAMLAALHAEKISKEEEERRVAEQEEDDALVAQYFTKLAPRTAQPARKGGASASAAAGEGAKSKLKLKTMAESTLEAGSDDETDDKGKRATTADAAADTGADADTEGAVDSDDDGAALPSAPSLTIKRRAGAGSAGEPSVAALLASKGKSVEGLAPAPPAGNAQVKRKREGMQKLLGIKKKVKA